MRDFSVADSGERRGPGFGEEWHSNASDDEGPLREPSFRREYNLRDTKQRRQRINENFVSGEHNSSKSSVLSCLRGLDNYQRERMALHGDIDKERLPGEPQTRAGSEVVDLQVPDTGEIISERAWSEEVMQDWRTESSGGRTPEPLSIAFTPGEGANRTLTRQQPWSPGSENEAGQRLLSAAASEDNAFQREYLDSDPMWGPAYEELVETNPVEGRSGTESEGVLPEGNIMEDSGSRHGELMWGPEVIEVPERLTESVTTGAVEDNLEPTGSGDAESVQEGLSNGSTEPADNERAENTGSVPEGLSNGSTEPACDGGQYEAVESSEAPSTINIGTSSTPSTISIGASSTPSSG